MKKIKFISTASLLTLMSTAPLCLYGCGSKNTTTIHISMISDTHGEIPGYGDDFFNVNKTYPGAIRTVDKIQRLQNGYPGSITLLCGDQNGSGTFSTCAQGDTMYPVLSAMNCVYSAVGNHAWDFGKDKLETGHIDSLGRTKDTRGSYLMTSNVLNDSSLQTKTWIYKEDQQGFLQDYYKWKNTKVAWADNYKLLDLAGHKVALIGLTTKRALEDSAKSEIKGLSFIDYIPAIHYTKYEMKQDIGEENFNKIDAFIALTHVEAKKSEDGQIEGAAAEVCKNIDTKLDLFLSGHWHSDVADTVHNDNLNKDIPIMASKAHMQSFCDATVVFDDTKPEGQRLKSITPSTQTCNIEQDKEKANKQIQDIIDNPFNDVVKNTCKVYKEQKAIAMKKLDEKLGQSTNGLKYDILEHWDRKYVNSGVEQAGVYASKGNVVGAALIHQAEIAQNKLVKPSFSIIANDSIRQAINPGEVKLRDVYGVYAFDNKPVYLSLTYFQLEQVVKYMLFNQTRDTATNKSNDYSESYYTEKLYYKDGVEVPKEDIGDIRIPYCPGQYGGFAFSVNKKTTNGTISYEYVPDSLKIYAPDENGSDIDNIDTYKDKAYWENKLIAGIVSNFLYNDGNMQYKMVKRFSAYNDKQSTTEDKYKTQLFDEDVRSYIISTMKDDTAKSKTIDVPVETLNKMFNGF